MEHGGPRKQRSDFVGNPADHVTLRDSWGYRYGWVGDARPPTTLSLAYVTLRDSWGYRYGWVGDARPPTTLSVAYVGAK